MTKENYLLRDESDRIAELEAEVEILRIDKQDAIKSATAMVFTQRAMKDRWHKAEAQRDKLLEALKVVVEANGGAACYASKYDEIGEYACCGELSYKPHDPDCYVSVARAAIAEVEGK